MASLYRALLDDDGTLEASLRGDKRLRARLLRAIIRCIEDTENPRNAIYVAEAIADRLEGRPVQKVKAPMPLQAILYEEGHPPPHLRLPPKPPEPNGGPAYETMMPPARASAEAKAPEFAIFDDPRGLSSPLPSP